MTNYNTSINLQEINEVLKNTYPPSICVSYWLGNANVLFIGFGNDIIPPPERRQNIRGKFYFKHLAEPPYEIQTRFADWRIEIAGELYCESVTEFNLENVASKLIGKSVLKCEILQPGFGLSVEFEGSVVLKVYPYEYTSSDYVWSIRDTNGMIFFISSDGAMFKCHESSPYS